MRFLRNSALFTLVAISSLAFTGNSAFAAWTFTNCGKEGRTGPEQFDCDAAYVGTELDGSVSVLSGVQEWIVPATGTYRIEALGGAGGTNLFGGPFSVGGMGASISGDFELIAGETLYFLVGQKGEDTRDNLVLGSRAAPGGGGASFVYRNDNDPTPLIAAGGGGSGSRLDVLTTPANQHASAGPNGNDSGNVANGGIAGNGGRSNVAVDLSYWGGGGGGWLTNGTGGNNPTDYNFLGGDEGADGGRSPRNVAQGGVRYNDGTDEGGDGGFGGGGGGGSDAIGGGGGGGFSGGGGAAGDDNHPGGGGGSFNAGTNQVNISAANSGHGQIVVTAIGLVEAPAIPTLSYWGLIALVLFFILLGTLSLRRTA